LDAFHAPAGKGLRCSNSKHTNILVNEIDTNKMKKNENSIFFANDLVKIHEFSTIFQKEIFSIIKNKKNLDEKE
jgi:hypothetical protein